MALTVAQQNAHLKTIMANVAQVQGRGDAEVIYALLRGCIVHVRLGGADNIEAGKFWAQALFQSVIGRNATAADLHLLKNHLATQADETASGVL